MSLLTQVLESSDLAPVLEKMHAQLVTKNVASEIADDIIASVRSSLEGQRLASFTRVKTAVVGALKEAVSTRASKRGSQAVEKRITRRE